MKQRIISFIVSNQPGVLSRIAGLISRRGYNIDSLTVGVTNDANLSRMTIVLKADETITEQVVKQLDKLIDVKHIKEIKENAQTMCEVALIKLALNEETKIALMEKIEQIWGRVLDIGYNTATIEVSGLKSYIDDAIKQLAPFDIKEIARTGMVALERGDELLTDE